MGPRRHHGRTWVSVVTVAAILAVGPAASTQTNPVRRFTVVAAGDIIPHTMLVDSGDAYLPGPGWDFTPMVATIEPWISGADLALCHLEGTLSPSSTGLSGYPRFVGPHEMAAAIVAAGWDGCSTASNHSMDGDAAGVIRTLEVLDSYGLGHAGTARTPEERLPTFYDVGGVRVAHISYTYGTNGLPVPTATPWAVNVIDAAAILADAAWAREHGSQFTIVSLHWGEQYRVDPTAGQVALGTTLAASPDVDVILGHHAHVVQPIDKIGDTYVVYGMGNHLSNQFSRWGPGYFATEDGLLVRLHVAEGPDGRFEVASIEITPTWVEYPGYRVHAAADAALTRGAAAQVSYDRTIARSLALSPPDVTVSPSLWPEAYCGHARGTIIGTPGKDVLVGTPGRDVIVARGGDDIVFGGDGDDLICGGDGDDSLDGGSGRDILLGGPGNDLLIGTARDVLIGGDGVDRCSSQAPLRDCER